VAPPHTGRIQAPGRKKTTFYKSEISGLKLASVTAAVKFAGAPACGANGQESSVKTAISRAFPQGRPYSGEPGRFYTPIPGYLSGLYELPGNHASSGPGAFFMKTPA